MQRGGGGERVVAAARTEEARSPSFLQASATVVRLQPGSPRGHLRQGQRCRWGSAAAIAAAALSEEAFARGRQSSVRSELGT